MVKKEDLTKLMKNAGDLKVKATDIAKGASKNLGTVKQAVQAGVATSKTVIKGASQVINKDGIATGLEVTSKGVDIAAKGARLASKGADALASTMEKASSGVKKLTAKLKK